MKRHGFDPISFLLGALFVSVGASAMFADGAEAVNPGRLWAIATVAAGGTLVTWVLTRALGGPLKRWRDETTVEKGVDVDGSGPAALAKDAEQMPREDSHGPGLQD